MSYIEKFGMTEAEFDAVMNEAHDHFQACAEQQQQYGDEDFDGGDFDRNEPDDFETMNQNEVDDYRNEGDDDSDPSEDDDNADDFEPQEDQFLDGYMEDRMSGGYDF